MRRPQYFLQRLQVLWRSEHLHDEINEELSFHIDQRTADNIRQGMQPDEARREAEKRFGRLSRIKEEGYEVRGAGWIDDLQQDLRYGLRTLFKHRWFTSVTVLTLALGIGACTAVFSLVNAVLIRSLPYGEPGRLVYLFTPNTHLDIPAEIFGPANADFFDLRKQSHSFADMTLFDQATYNLEVGDQVERIGAARVDADFFSTLQSPPEFGRVFHVDDEQSGNESVAVIAYGLWQGMFGGRADAIGSTIRLDGKPYRVVGIMPKDFGFPHRSDLKYGNGRIDTTEIWLPSALTSGQMADREGSSGNAIARLKPAVTLKQALAEMSALMVQLDKLHSPRMRGWVALVKPFRDNAVGPVKPLMWLLVGSVAFVLLIACGNAANLLLARGADRTHELGVRAALGARRSRLIRQMLTESLLLSAAAGCVGIALGYLLLRTLLRLNPGDIPRMQNASLDITVLTFLIAITALTSILFGVLPALASTRINPAEFLSSGGTRGVIGNRAQLRKALAVAQVALTVVLLTGAGLLLRSYVNVISVDTGFSASTVTANVQLTPRYDTPQKQSAFFQDLLERIKRIHGVQATGAVDYLPLSSSESLAFFEVEGYANQKNQLVEARRITPDYLSAMQTPLLKGKGFDNSDSQEGSPTVIVNQAFAKKYFGTDDAIGRHLRTGRSGPWATVIGVTSDVRNMSLESAALPEIFFPFLHGETKPAPMQGIFIATRALLPQDAIVSELRAALRSLDPDLAIADVHAMSELVSQASARRRFQTTLVTVFSAVAMALAVVGIYGLLAYSVKQRTGEIGLRMALGSSKMGAVRLILGEGLGLLAVGLVVGLAAALASARLLASFLYQVSAVDPVTFFLVPTLLSVATLAACLIPSARAAAIDPMNALRHQ